MLTAAESVVGRRSAAGSELAAVLVSDPIAGRELAAAPVLDLAVAAGTGEALVGLAVALAKVSGAEENLGGRAVELGVKAREPDEKVVGSVVAVDSGAEADSAADY